MTKSNESDPRVCGYSKRVGNMIFCKLAFGPCNTDRCHKKTIDETMERMLNDFKKIEDAQKDGVDDSALR